MNTIKQILLYLMTISIIGNRKLIKEQQFWKLYYNMIRVLSIRLHI